MRKPSGSELVGAQKAIYQCTNNRQPSTVNHSPQPAHVADEPRFEPAAAARMPARITTRPLDQLKCSPL